MPPLHTTVAVALLITIGPATGQAHELVAEPEPERTALFDGPAVGPEQIADAAPIASGPFR